MTGNDNEKGNLQISYLFHKGTKVLNNLDNENEMVLDLQRLAEEWKKKGYIKRYIIAGDEVLEHKRNNIEDDYEG